MLNLIKVKFLGGEAREFGGEVSPCPPPTLDETLIVTLISENVVDLSRSRTVTYIFCLSNMDEVCGEMNKSKELVLKSTAIKIRELRAGSEKSYYCGNHGIETSHLEKT